MRRLRIGHSPVYAFESTIFSRSFIIYLLLLFSLQFIDFSLFLYPGALRFGCWFSGFLSFVWDLWVFIIFLIMSLTSEFALNFLFWYLIFLSLFYKYLVMVFIHIWKNFKIWNLFGLFKFLLYSILSYGWRMNASFVISTF